MHPHSCCMYKWYAGNDRRLAPKHRRDGDEASRSAVNYEKRRQSTRSMSHAASLLRTVLQMCFAACEWYVNRCCCGIQPRVLVGVNVSSRIESLCCAGRESTIIYDMLDSKWSFNITRGSPRLCYVVG